MSMNNLAAPTQAIQAVQHPISEPISTMIFTTPSTTAPALVGSAHLVSARERKRTADSFDNEILVI